MREDTLEDNHVMDWTTMMYRKVSQAAINTLRPFWMSQKQTFDRLVLLPTPFTPTKVMLYGNRCCEEGKGDDNFVLIDSRRSVDVLGVSMRVRELDSARRTAVLVASGILETPVKWMKGRLVLTLEPAHFLAH